MKNMLQVFLCLSLSFGLLFAGAKQVKPVKPTKNVKSSKAVKPVAKKTAPAAVKREREASPLDRFDWYYAQRAWPLGYIPAGMQAEGVFQINRMERDRDSVLQALGVNKNDVPANQTTWTLVGSAPSNTVGFNFPRTAGRVGAVAIDPRDANVVFAGTSNGGVWKTTNGGTTWAPLSDTQPSLVIGSLIMDPRNPNTLYAGTGERTYGGGHASYDGVGILKTTDGGTTWTHIPGPWMGPFGSSTGGGRIASLALHPTNSQILLAGSGSTATTRGVFRSTDGGATWTRVLSTGSVNTVVFNATDGNVAYAAVQENGISKSTDGGVTWSTASAGLPTEGIGRIELAISNSSPNTLYVGLSDQARNNALRGFYKSTDGAATWTQLTNTPDYCADQCFFDHMVTVHPTNADVVLVGGSDTNGEQQRKLFRTMDGGNSWTEISQGANRVGLHPDVHVAVFTADGAKLYVGHDGGLNSTTNVLEAGVNWTDLNAGFATTLYYPGLSIHPTNVDVSFAGTQDNGTQGYTGTVAWTEVACGDGGYTAIDPSNPSLVYAACQQISVLKSTNGGAAKSFNDAQSGLPDSKAERSQFIAPLIIDQTAPGNLYFGTFRVWQTTDGAGNWRPISADLSGNGEATVSALVVAPTDSNTVYAGYSNGKVFVRTNALAGGTDGWVERSTGIPGRHVTSLVVGQTSTTVYATVSGYTFGNDNLGHVFKSTNGGTTWADISGSLPNVPFNDLAIDPDVAGKLYVGTDVGVFVSSNDGGAWTPLGSGLPRVAVTSVRMHKPSRTLRAATFGRSAWDILVPLAGGGPLPTVAAVGALDGASFKAPVAAGSIAAIFGTNLGTTNTLAGSVPLPTQLAGASLVFNGNIVAPLFFAGAGQINLQIPWELAGQTTASLIATTGNGSSTAVTASLAPAAPAMFSTNQQGTGQGVVLIASTGEVAAPTGSIQGRAHRPVRKGEFLTIYCLGLGDVDNRPATGRASPSAEPLARVRTVPTVTMGGVDAHVDFAGLAPGFVGLYQINVQVPDSAPSGDAVSMIIRAGGATSNTVTIAVQ